MNAEPVNVAGERGVTGARDVARTAPARCLVYGVFSGLLASPHDVDVRDQLPTAVGTAEGLPYPLSLDGLLREFAGCDPEQLKEAYSGLFEVGSQGPPVPIREDLITGQKAGCREDIVRFYDYFGYRLADNFAWAPDHLSVELEFMHFLAWHEANAAEDILSWQLAQADFAQRHLKNWVPLLAGAVAELAPDSFYSRMLRALEDFVSRDLAWQGTTIVTTPEPVRR